MQISVDLRRLLCEQVVFLITEKIGYQTFERRHFNVYLGIFVIVSDPT
jgi:hypothetical protein